MSIVDDWHYTFRLDCVSHGTDDANFNALNARIKNKNFNNDILALKIK